MQRKFAFSNSREGKIPVESKSAQFTPCGSPSPATACRWPAPLHPDSLIRSVPKWWILTSVRAPSPRMPTEWTIFSAAYLHDLLLDLDRRHSPITAHTQYRPTDWSPSPSSLSLYLLLSLFFWERCCHSFRPLASSLFFFIASVRYIYFYEKGSR
jgi:hypothetical protein